jgi:AcrR family transcriptional regulator
MVTKRAEATVSRIMAAAEKLFLAKNYAEVTMDQIAEEAMATKGALYHHFDSKEELYLLMMFNDLEAKRKLFGKAVSSKGTCRDRLGRLTAAFFGLPRPKRRLIRLVRRDINVFRGEARAKLVRAYQNALPKPVERAIKIGIKEGELPAGDPRLLSWQFVALVEILLTDYAGNLFEGDESKLDHVLDLFFGGVAGNGPAES